jgi:hypothetical protein
LRSVCAAWQHDVDDGHSRVTKLRGDHRFSDAGFEQHDDVHIMPVASLTRRQRVDDPFEATKGRRREHVHELHRFDAMPASRRLKPWGEIPAGMPRRGNASA